MLPAGLTDEEWAALSPAEQDEWAAHQEDVAGRESLRAFMVRMAPHHPPPRHLDPLIDEFEAARAEPRFVCVSMPPGHAKTTVVLNAFAWWLSINPGDTHAYCSYNNAQAYSKSVLARNLTAAAGVELSEAQNAKSEWRTDDGGGLLATGVEGGLTGQRVTGLLVIDDPFKNRLDAYSATQRERVDDWFRTVPMTRRQGCSVFIVHTRWHEDDLIGRLKKRGQFRVINLPAIANERDVLGRAPGEALWPDSVYSLPWLLDQKKTIGDFDFAALYQGEPRPRGGSVFGEPHYYDPDNLDLHGCKFVLAGDPAASTRTSADYSAAVVLAVKGKGSDRMAYVVHVYREQVTVPQFANDLLGLQQKYGQTAINIESVGGFKAIPQMLKAIRPNLRIKEIVPQGDKFQRAQAVAAAWNTGRVLVPASGAAWLGPFLDELAEFSGVNDAYDDQVDALSHAWNAGPKVSMFDVG